MKRCIFIIIIINFLYPVLAQAQSIVGTWHSTDILILSESAKERELIITKNSIVINTKTQIYDYKESVDTAGEITYNKTNYRDTVESETMEIVSTIADPKILGRGHFIVIRPDLLTSEEKPSYSIARYTLIDENNAVIAMAFGDDPFKTKDEAEKAYKTLPYLDIYTLITPERLAFLKTLKNPKFLTKDEVLIICTNIREYAVNKVAPIPSLDENIDRAYIYSVESGITQQISQTLESMGYNPLQGNVTEAMKNHEDDPQIKEMIKETNATLKRKRRP
jgi:hypothetical protein